MQTVRQLIALLQQLRDQDAPVMLAIDHYQEGLIVTAPEFDAHPTFVPTRPGYRSKLLSLYADGKYRFPATETEAMVAAAGAVTPVVILFGQNAD